MLANVVGTLAIFAELIFFYRLQRHAPITRAHCSPGASP